MSEGRKPPANRKVSPALARIAQRALVCDQDDIRAYNPTELDLQIAEAMIAGNTAFNEIAETIECSPSHVSQAMKNPVACAWISAQVHKMCAYRLGQIDAAMMSRAVAGDVRAADLLYKRFGQIVQRQETTVNHVNDFDATQLTDDQLNTLVANKGRTIDAEFEVTEDSPESPKK